jgi:hypothetical protein
MPTLSPSCAWLLLTIITFRYYEVSIGLVYSIHDPTEVPIKKMIEASQRMLRINSQEGEELEGMSPPLKRHLELEIKTLENAPRDADKLEHPLQVKQNKRKKQCISKIHKG